MRRGDSPRRPRTAASLVAIDSGSLHRVDRRTGSGRGPAYDLPPVAFRTRVAVGAGAAWVAPFFGRDVLARVPLRKAGTSGAE
jgi:hypothetical protein